MKNRNIKIWRNRAFAYLLTAVMAAGIMFNGTYSEMKVNATEVNEFTDLECSAGGYHSAKTYRATCNSTAECKKCGQTYYDKHNHYDENYDYSSTIMINYKAATKETDGYSGDVYCADCNTLLKKGHVIDAYQNDFGLSNPVITDGRVRYDTVYFGSYWQDDTNKDGVADTADEKTPIKWKVLSVNKNKALLVSEYALDYMLWGSDSISEAGGWKNSFARGWLNGYSTTGAPYDYTQDGNSFISSAFNVVERNAILTTTLDNSDVTKNITSIAGFAYIYDEYQTQDKIFPLSFDDLTDYAYGYNYLSSYNSVISYYSDDKKGKTPVRCTKITPFAAMTGSGNAMERGFESASGYKNYANIYYGLRTKGTFVYAFGAIDHRPSNSHSYAVVPALYLDLNKVNEYLLTKAEPVEEINKAVDQMVIANIEHTYNKGTFNISISRRKSEKYVFYNDTETGIDNFEKTYITLSGDTWDLEKLYLCTKRGDKDVSAELIKGEDGRWFTSDSFYDDVINEVKRTDAEKKSMVKDVPGSVVIKYLSSADNELHEIYNYDFLFTTDIYHSSVEDVNIDVDGVSLKYRKQSAEVDVIRKRMTQMTYYTQRYGGGNFGETKVELSGEIENIDQIWIAANRNNTLVSAELFSDGDGMYTTVSQFLDDERNGINYSDEKKTTLLDCAPKDFKIICTLKDTPGYHMIYSFASNFIIDPSGYAYEAVESNRIEGVTATIYGAETSSGDNSFEFMAEAYGQVNPQVTGKDGFYAWDVPEGYWQICLEKDGYSSVKSEWLPVPPPQLDVNLSMVDASSPIIENVELTKDSFEVRFNKYLKVDTVKTGAFVLTSEGQTYAVSEVKAINEESGLARDFKVTLAKEIENIYTNKTYKLSVQGPVSYAGTTMELTTMDGIKAGYAVEKIICRDKVSMGKEEFNLTIKVEPADKCALRQAVCKVSDSDILEVVKCGVFDSEGVATVTLKGKKTGVSDITVGIEGSTKTADAVVIVAANSKMLANIQKYNGKTVSGAAAKEYDDVWAELAKKYPEYYSEKPGEYKTGALEDVTLKVGTVITVGKAKYVVGKNNTVTYKAATSKKVASVNIPDTVKIKGKTYKVTAISAHAFKNNKKLKKVTIGKNVKTIGKSAFYGCKSLKTIIIKTTKLTSKSVGKNAFAKINSKAKVKVSKAKLKSYKKLLKSKGIKGKKQKVTK